MSLFLGTLLVSKQIDSSLYYLVSANKVNETLIKKNKYLNEVHGLAILGRLSTDYLSVLWSLTKFLLQIFIQKTLLEIH